MHLFYEAGPQPVLAKAPRGSLQDLMLCWGRARASARRLPVLLLHGAAWHLWEGGQMNLNSASVHKILIVTSVIPLEGSGRVLDKVRELFKLLPRLVRTRWGDINCCRAGEGEEVS